MQDIKSWAFKVCAKHVKRYEEGKLKLGVIDTLKVNEA